MARFGYCRVKNRDHILDDFTSRQRMVMGRLMNITVCRYCEAYPDAH